METVKVKTKADMRSLKRALKTLEKFNKTAEKANSLLGELADSEIEVDIVTNVQQSHRILGRRFHQALRRRNIHKQCRYKELKKERR